MKNELKPIGPIQWVVSLIILVWYILNAKRYWKNYLRTRNLKLEKGGE